MESLLMSNMEEDEEGEEGRELEESDDDFDEDQHNRLLEAMSSLSSKKNKKNSQRTIAHTDISEFGFDKKDEKSRLNLNELVANINSSHVSNLIKKNMRRLSSVKQAKIPLTKPEQEKITRKIAYDLKKEEVSKWQPLVKENQKAEQLTFPLNRPDVTLRTSDEMTKRFQARTPLELEIAKLLHGSSYVENKTKMLTPAEEKALKAMNLEEARERRAELMKYRALMTYNEAKFRRRKKIKSKRYHKILRKEKLKREEKELDELQKTDPEAYLEKIEYANKARIEERMTLKHRGGSKFARKKMMYARYDPVARQAVQDMIDKNKELTKKQYESSDEESEGGVSMEEEAELQMLSSSLDTKGNNPWMKAPAKPSDFSRPQQLRQEKETEDDDDEDDEDDEELMVKLKTDDVDLLQLEAKRLKKIKEKKQKKEVFDLSNIDTWKQDGDEDEDEVENLERKLSLALEQEEEDEEEDVKLKNKDNMLKKGKQDVRKDKLKVKKDKLKVKKEKLKVKKEKQGVKKNLECDESEDDENKDVDTLFNILDEMEKQISKRKKEKKEKLTRCKIERLDIRIKDKIPDEDEDDDDEEINQSTTRKRTLEEFEGNWKEEEEVPTKIKKTETELEEKNEGRNETPSLDPNKLFTVEGDVINTRVNGEDDVSDDDDEDVEDEKMTIAQAFADDDVIEEFNLEKEDIAEEEKNKDINLVLPGWGDWGGEGIEVNQKKKAKFIIKGKNKERKDSKLGNVIINEKKDEALAEHQVKQLPKKFLNPTQFEQSISQPIGSTWNPEKAFHRMIKPVVVTKLGTVIKPIDKEEMFKKQQINKKANKSFDKHLPSNKNNTTQQSKFKNVEGLKKVIAGKKK